MIQRRAAAAGIKTRIWNHTVRATGNTASLTNSGKLEIDESRVAEDDQALPPAQEEGSPDEVEWIAT